MPENTKKYSLDLPVKTKEDLSNSQLPGKSTIHPPTSIWDSAYSQGFVDQYPKEKPSFASCTSDIKGPQSQWSGADTAQTLTDGSCHEVTHAADYSS